MQHYSNAQLKQQETYFIGIMSVFFLIYSLGVNHSVQDLLCQDTRIHDLYFNISEMKLSITSLFSVQVMSYLGASDLIYSDVNDSFISEILKYSSLRPSAKDPGL